jgi:hypothetical protein
MLSAELKHFLYVFKTPNLSPGQKYQAVELSLKAFWGCAVSQGQCFLSIGQRAGHH